MRKAGGKSGILPEFVRHGGPELWDRILKLMKCGRVGKVVRDWQDAESFLFSRKVISNVWTTGAESVS